MEQEAVEKIKHIVEKYVLLQYLDLNKHFDIYKDEINYKIFTVIIQEVKLINSFNQEAYRDSYQMLCNGKVMTQYFRNTKVISCYFIRSEKSNILVKISIQIEGCSGG